MLRRCRQPDAVHRRLCRWARCCYGRVPPRRSGSDWPPRLCPGDLLKFYIYGYLNRVRSSRRLEAETHRNLE
jgi:hypothetical protein